MQKQIAKILEHRRAISKEIASLSPEEQPLARASVLAALLRADVTDRVGPWVDLPPTGLHFAGPHARECALRSHIAASLGADTAAMLQSAESVNFSDPSTAERDIGLLVDGSFVPTVRAALERRRRAEAEYRTEVARKEAEARAKAEAERRAQAEHRYAESLARGAADRRADEIAARNAAVKPVI